MARDIAGTNACAVSRRERRRAGVLFALRGRILRLDRLRGPSSGARDKFHLAAQDLRKPAEPIPAPATAA